MATIRGRLKREMAGEDMTVCALEALVAENDDPEFQCRIKVIIPSIDEDHVHDVWVRRITLFSGPEGYGDFHPPGKGSEVVLFGRMGQRYNLFYAPVYNETHVAPADFRSTTVRGIRTDGDYKQIVELDYQLRAGRARIETDASVEIIAAGGIYLNGRRA